MKYMTPELLAKLQSPDEAVVDLASEQWDAACAAYLQRVSELRPALSRPVKGFLDCGCLHDARVLTIAGDERSFFSIFVQPDEPKYKLMELKYLLPHGMFPDPVRHAELADHGAPFKWWLYDEIEIQQTVPTLIYQHSILFAGGWELRVPFKTMKVKRYQAFLAQSDGSTPEEAAGCFARLLKRTG